MDRPVLAPAVNSPAPAARRRGKSAPVSDTAHAGDDPICSIMRDILHSAAEVLDADQAIIQVSRHGEAPRTTAILYPRPERSVNAVLRRAALPIRAALDQRRIAAADHRGHEVPFHNNTFAATPGILCLPLEPNPRLRGALCLIRRQGAAHLTALDLEIVQALAEQAALTMGAVSHQRALGRLEASLSRLLPAAN